MKGLFVALTFLATSSLALIVPPHPDFADEYARITQKKRRRNLRSSNNNATAPVAVYGNVDPRFCSDLSEAECRRLNMIASKSTAITLSVIKEKKELKTLVLLMRFTDHWGRALPSKDEIDRLWNSDQISETFPTGSIRRYLEQNSYGSVKVRATVADWLTTDNTELHYSFNGQSGLTREFAAALLPVLRQLDDQGYDFAQHDTNGDMVIDNLAVLHSGYQAEIGQHDCFNERGHEDRIWSHAIPNLADELWRSRSGYTFTTYMVASALSGVCGSKPSQIGVMTHELIHTWGIPDLYDTNWDGKGTGHYTIMSNPFGFTGGQTHPGFLDPWSRITSGFVNPIPITEDREYAIRASAIAGDVYIYNLNFPEGEYLLIENRQQLEYDRDLKGSGLLIWHIDEEQPRNSLRGFPGQEGWPWNNQHYMVALLQADGKYDLEQGANAQDANDFFRWGDEIGPNGVKRDGNFMPHPNTNSYKGGAVTSTGFRIYDISESAETMTFRVSGIGPPGPPTSAPSDRPSASPTPRPSNAPTPLPTPSPTPRPTDQPTPSPTPKPSSSPSAFPTPFPSVNPTPEPTMPPTEGPTNPPTIATTSRPTGSISPTETPLPPSSAPTGSISPTASPTEFPSVILSNQFGGSVGQFGSFFDKNKLSNKRQIDVGGRDVGGR